MGAKALGDRLVAHAGVQKSTWLPAFYNAYYLVLTGYLEEINYAGGQPAATPGSSALPAVISGSSAVVDGTATAVAAAPAVISAAAPAARTLKQRLGDLKELLDEEIITRDEFDVRRQEILAEV